MNRSQSLSALSMMLRSRYFENKTEELFKAGLIHGTTHLANGQEACQAGLCMALDDNDWIVPTHRCHGFTIAKGSSAYSMFCEMFGSSQGLAKGLGGSMHMPDKEHGNLGSSAVVGSGVPLAAGIAWYYKRHNLKNIAVAIFGDGASSRGSIHEVMNLASIWKLPILFYCENNRYGMSASADDMVSVPHVSDRSSSYSMPGLTIDGNDVEKVFEETSKAVKYIKDGNGPFFLEVMTYRQKGHSKSDSRVYRSREEEKAWLEKDPIVLFENKLIANNVLTIKDIKALESKIEKEIQDESDRALKVKDQILSKQEVLNLVYDEGDGK